MECDAGPYKCGAWVGLEEGQLWRVRHQAAALQQGGSGTAAGGQRCCNSGDMTSAARPGTGEAVGGLTRSTSANSDLFKYFRTNLN
jgi:hypothetical protein